MIKNKPDIKTDITQIVDRGELPALMEPLRIAADSRFREELNDLAIELAAKAAGFRSSLPQGISASLSHLVRAMNCYYSNLIEDHNTHPVDIERALKNDYHTDPHKRNLQLEAKAHILVQSWIDEGGLNGRALTTEGIAEIHKQFGEHLPDELLVIENPDSGERVQITPGLFRTQDVKVGKHIPISPGALPRFMARFENVFSGLGKAEMLISQAAAHHRLLWIHPFSDGNGRVARLMSHAILQETLDTGSIWSIARGLARNADTYKMHLANCDQGRRNDLDGRGNLSEQALVEFSRFFLKTCLDQINFMAELIQPERLRHRILTWAKEEIDIGALPPKSELILEALLYRGELPRSKTAEILGVGDRQGRRLISALTAKDILISKSSRAPLRLAFPAHLASRWMPGLFPDP